MQKYISYCLFLFLIFLGRSIFSQTLTLSPYSRYGVGDVFSYSSTRNAGMGGIGIGSTAVFTPNRLNPASYADFLFYNSRKRFDLRRTTLDVGGFAMYSSQSTKLGTSNQTTAGFRDLSYLFPSNKKIAFVAGFTPYSTVGYSVIDTARVMSDADTLLTQISYKGKGGINQFYIGAGTAFLKNKLRVGGNLYFSFGNIQYEWISAIADVQSNLVRTTKTTRMNGFGALLGVQYQDTLKRDSTGAPILFRIGGISDIGFPMNGTQITEYASYNSSNGVIDTLGKEETQKVVLPQKWGLGVEFSKPLVWYVGADVLYQNWQNFRYFNSASTLRKDIQVSLGGEWTPNFTGDKYYQRVSYRTGAYYHKTYIALPTSPNQPINDMGFTVGFGLPMSKSKQFLGDFIGRFNLSAEVGQRGNLQYHPLKEFYTRVRFGITISERWFVRRVVD